MPILHVALWEPEIAPNTGAIARLCAATGATLHLIGRLGFRLTDRDLRRAGLDYWDRVDVTRHLDWSAFRADLGGIQPWLFSAHGSRPYTLARFRAEDYLVFGNESHGLPPAVLENGVERVLTIPMPGGGVRSLNLATAVGIAVYEALRQLPAW